ncbi:MAG: AAA family ATPase [Actinobacteria bacterium]|nr:AAA family ATPase [Actinomycetota bacterium]
MARSSELEAEQAWVDHAYDCLEAARRRVLRLREITGVGPGGTHQARLESEVVEETIRARMAQLEVGDGALVFGRIDPGDTDERFYIGRVAVADDNQEPVVVDWRAPVAEPFYRATGRHPMGLSRRRHFASRGSRLLDYEDELFGDDLGLRHRDRSGPGPEGLAGRRVLLAALDRPRTGRLGDIVGTIQAEQDEIIRSELGGVVVVQGGPGTGKTVVALHRAAYLLYTHRFPLEGQGLLVIGPNRLYLGYIDRVLPSLGEAGVELATLADLVPEAVGEGRERPETALMKGDLRMAAVLAKAVADRERPLRRDLVLGLGLQRLRCDVASSRRLVERARRRAGRHNAGRPLVEQGLWEVLARSARREVEPAEVREQLRRHDDVRAALEWMWPVLDPAELLRDLFGSPALIRLAAAGRLDDDEQRALYQERGERSAGDLRWTGADVALLDEARALLGPRPSGTRDEPRSYGHLVVDEAQDLSPMELRMLARRSLGGSMTVVGDIAQATGAWAPTTWADVLEHLPSRHPPRVHELTVAYRTPATLLRLAARLLAAAGTGLSLPTSVREGGEEPVIVATEERALAQAVAERAELEQAAVGEGNVAVVVPRSLADAVAAALAAAGVEHSRAETAGLDGAVTVVPVHLVKGLELDSVVVVEPAAIVAEEPQGLRALYVALTRATRRLTVVHARALPVPVADGATSP